MNPGRIRTMVVKEVRELLRDPITIAVALALPMVMLFLFGYAVSLDVRNVHYAVWDRDNSQASRALADTFEHSRYFTFVGAMDGAGLDKALRRGNIRMALIIPERFEQHLIRGENAPVQILVDGTASNIAQIVVGYADAIVSAFRNTDIPPVQPEVRVWYNPELRSANYVIPGLLGVILMAFPPMLTALAVVREKESRSIEQIFASPLTSAEFLVGKLLPYGVIAFIEFLIVMTAGLMWFAVPFRGSVLLLSLIAMVYVLCTVALGLFVSTITRSQVAAMLLALVISLMPSALFSGFLFPIFTMPYVLQVYSAAFPARYFIEVSRAIALKGSGIGEIWPNVVILFVYTLGLLALAAWRVKKKVA